MNGARGFAALALLCACALASAARADSGALDGSGARDISAALDNSAGDADAIAGACGAVPAVGCCDGERLLFCEGGTLRALSCVARPRCGFNPARGIYDCNTSGSTDPSGRTARECFFGDAGAPAVDALAAPDACGDVTEEGCCAGEVLRYCDRGVVREVDCRPNQICGWRGSGLLYDCGTQGGEDPSGAYPRKCSGVTPDLGSLRYDAGGDDAAGDAAASDGAASAGDGATPAADGGCGCSAAPAPPSWPLLLLSLAVAIRYRYRHRHRHRP